MKKPQRTNSERETLHITVELKAYPGRDILGVKEALSMYCEQFGDIKLVDVKSKPQIIPEQIKL